jgi:hypothetical protein
MTVAGVVAVELRAYVCDEPRDALSRSLRVAGALHGNKAIGKPLS